MASKSTDWRPGPTVCRCCLSEGCYKDISTEYFWMGKREVYAEMLLDSFNLSIAYSQSGGPNSNSRLICEPCISRLRDASEFKRQVQECEKTFMQYLDPGSTAIIADLEAPLETLDSQVKVEKVKLEKQLSDVDDFEDRPDFIDDDDDDLDDQPLTTFATKIPKKESVDLLDLLDNAKAGEKRKSSSKSKTSPAKKAKTKKETPKPTSSKTIKPEKKKKDDEGKKNELKISLGISTIKTMTTEVVKTAEIIANRNSAVALIVNTSASCPFRYVNQFYVCVYCQERYEEFSSLYQHVIAVHHSVSETMVREALTTIEKEQKIKVNFMNLTCKICNASFNDFKELKLHLKTDHKEPVDVDNDGVLPYKILDNIYECLLCGINFQNYTNLNKHIKTHSPYFTCNHCGKRYTTLRALKVHTAKHKHLRSREKSHKTCPIVKVKDQNSDRLENKKNNCPICQETFEHSHEIVEHFKNVHGNTSVNTISIPGDGVARQSQNSFQKSVKKRNHKDNAVAIILNTNACPFRYKGNFMCMYCQNKFDVIDDLIQHTINDHQNVTEADIRKAITKPPTKLNIMDFVCKLCNKELTDFEDLKHHLIGKHKKEIDLENDDLMAYSIKGDDYVCVRCGYKCENYNELSKHINDHFNTFICDQCGRGFGSKTSLHSHTLSHIRGSDPCQICGKKYGNYASKLKHIKIAHHNIHIHRCPYCSETFKDYYPKLKHIAAVHGVKKYYNCRFCPKSFLTNSHFRNHERVAHAQGEKYVCDICDFSTYVKYSLKMHMVCHSDEKNFKCHLCNKSYSRKKCLVQHMKTHYNDRRFVCQHCGKAFVQKCRLTSHMKTVHTDIVKATK